VQAPASGMFLAGWLGSWLRSLWGEAGLGLDPNGVSAVPPAPGPAGATEEGLGLDPDGLKVGSASIPTAMRTMQV
jgi:hypothetical protein